MARSPPPSSSAPSARTVRPRGIPRSIDTASLPGRWHPARPATRGAVASCSPLQRAGQRPARDFPLHPLLLLVVVLHFGEFRVHYIFGARLGAFAASGFTALRSGRGRCEQGLAGFLERLGLGL